MATRYLESVDLLTALITYLALTPKLSRTPSNLARDLSLDEAAVSAALEDFPGIFRRSRTRSAEGAHYFTLHARYALRVSDAESDRSDLPALRADLLEVLLHTLSSRVQAEETRHQFERQLALTQRTATLGAFAAILAAVLAAVAVVVASLN